MWVAKHVTRCCVRLVRVDRITSKSPLYACVRDMTLKSKQRSLYRPFSTSIRTIRTKEDNRDINQEGEGGWVGPHSDRERGPVTDHADHAGISLATAAEPVVATTPTSSDAAPSPLTCSDPAITPADALAARLEARYGIRIPTDAERVAAGLDFNLRPVGGSTDSPESRRYPAWTLDDSLAADTAVVGSLVAEALARADADAADADAIPMRDAVRAARLAAAATPAGRLFAASA